MFFFLSKVLVFFIKPFNLLWIAAGLAVLFKGRVRRVAGIVAVVVFVIFSPGILLNETLLLWEVPAVQMDKLPGDHAVAIVLGGTADTDRPPYDRLYFTKGAERITQAVELYKRGKVSKILFTGGRSRLFEDREKDNAPIVNFYKACGVPPEDLIIENRARNTHENAVLAKAALREMGLLDARHLLLTSAFHMRRAHGCFEKEGVECTPFSTDFYAARPDDRFAPGQFLPSAGVLSSWEFLLKEFVGIVAYRLAGYI